MNLLPSLNTHAPSDHAALLSLLVVLLGNGSSVEKLFVAALLLQLRQNCTFWLFYKEISRFFIFLFEKKCEDFIFLSEMQKICAMLQLIKEPN